MSVHDGVVGEVDEIDPEAVEASNSLSARMERRSQELASQVSEIFEIPGWDEILEVELRLMGWEALRKIGIRNQKVKGVPMQELYTSVDQIVAGTEKFYELDDEGNRKPIKDTWTSLARRTGKNLPQDLTPRQAVLALVGDTRVMTLYNAWQEWMKGERSQADEELVRDFERTG